MRGQARKGTGGWRVPAAVRSAAPALMCAIVLAWLAPGVAVASETADAAARTAPAAAADSTDYLGHVLGGPRLLALGLGLILIAFAFVIRANVSNRLVRLAAAAPSAWREAMLRALARVLFVAGFVLGVGLIAYGLTDYLFVVAGESWQGWRTQSLNVLLYLALLYVAFEAIGPAGAFFESLAKRTETELDDRLAWLATYVLRGVVVIVGLFLLFDLIGAPPIALLVGLAIVGGLSLLIAFDTVRDIASSLQLLADPPFRVGDVIRAGETIGAVRRIGMRATELETPQRTRVLVPNHSLARQSIENLSLRSSRRIDFHLDVPRSTPPETLSRVLDAMYDRLLEHEAVGRERETTDPESGEPLRDPATGEPLPEGVDPLVVLAGIEDHGLRVQVRYDLLVVEFAEAARIQQTLLLELLQTLQDHGMELVGPAVSARDIGSVLADISSDGSAGVEPRSPTKRPAKKKAGSAKRGSGRKKTAKTPGGKRRTTATTANGQDEPAAPSPTTDSAAGSTDDEADVKDGERAARSAAANGSAG